MSDWSLQPEVKTQDKIRVLFSPPSYRPALASSVSLWQGNPLLHGPVSLLPAFADAQGLSFPAPAKDGIEIACFENASKNTHQNLQLFESIRIYNC
jgi:hypothetical protein